MNEINALFMYVMCVITVIIIVPKVSFIVVIPTVSNAF